MDRSVDSIGSCSLDVDADSTDFSDTSGELNFLTPISGKDITREFTAGIKERCMLPVINCQAVTSVLDPITGHISTVLTTTATGGNPQQQPPASNSILQPLLGGGGDGSPPSATNKKPSYLNLACCVNGYSNLTTYDSKLRQDINKSREVSPSRPIIATLHYNRTDSGTGGHLLTAPTLSYVSMNNTINNNYSGGAALIGGNRTLKMNGSAGVTNGRFRGINGSVVSPPTGSDMTDNAGAIGMFNGNGSFAGGLRTKVISSQSQISSHMRDDVQSQLMTPKKSFIQQRVEKLYGASDVVVLNKQNYSSSERKYLNNIANENNGTGVVGGTPVKTAYHGMSGQQHSIGNGTVRAAGVANGAGLYGSNGSNGTAFVSLDENNRQINGESHDVEDPDVDSLPVLRHLRPEFRAQLQIFSPKKIPKSSPNRPVLTSGAGSVFNGNGNVTHTNGNNSTVEDGTMLYTANGNSYKDKQQQQHDRQQILNDSSSRTKTISALSSSKTSNGQHQHVGDEEKVVLSASSRYHSNSSARTTTMHSTETEQTVEQQQQHHHKMSQSSRSSTSTSTSTSLSSSSTTVVVEEKLRSLVVVPPSMDDVSVGRMSAADGDSSSCAAIASAVVPEVQKSTTAEETSAIVTGEQNGTREVIRSDEHGNVPNLSSFESHVSERNGTAVELVNCDSSSVELVDDSMRTSNGCDTVVMDSAAVSALPVTTAGYSDVLAVEKNNSARDPATSCIEATTNGTSSDISGSACSNNNNVLDGNHFLRIMKAEQDRLRTMADEVEKEIDQLKAGGVELGEDVNGYILAAVGKARLLCSQKMKQFEDLCYTNLNQTPGEKFQTTGEDLRGFWDMVMLQVNNVDASFTEIDSFRKNGWRKPIPKSPPPTQTRNGTATRTKLVKRPYKTQTGASNGGSTVTDGSNGVEAKKASAALAAAKREAQRKQLMEMKRKQKLANSQPPTAVEIFATASEEARNGDDTTNCPSPAVSASALVHTS